MATYRQRGKKKTWDYRIVDKDKKLIASGSGFKTKKEAMYEAQSIEQELAKGTLFQTKASLYELWKEWYRLIIIPSKLSVSSKNKHLQRGKVIEKYFSHKPVSRIVHSEYQNFINEYCSCVLRSQVSRFNSVVKEVILMARRDGALLQDFTEGIKIVGEDFRKQAEDKYVQSIEDYKKILVYLKEIMDYEKSVVPYLLYLYFTTGLRTGEGLAVCWEDIDFEKNVLHTYRRYSKETGQFCPPKTKWSVRDVPISPYLIQVLLKLKREQEEILGSREIDNPHNLVFYDYRHGVPSNRTLNKHLRLILRKLDISDKMSITGTRHTYGSYLLANKVDIWVVSKILGHKDIKQLIETYGHLLKEIQQAEFEEVRQYLKV